MSLGAAMISVTGPVIGASGLLFLALGVFVASMRPRTRANVAFATYAAGYGISFFVIGIFATLGASLAPAAVVFFAFLSVLSVWVICPALIVLAMSAPRPLAGRERWLVIPALLFGGAMAATLAPAYLDGPSALDLANGAGIALAIGSLYGAAALLTLRFHTLRGAEQGRDRRRCCSSRASGRAPS